MNLENMTPLKSGSEFHLAVEIVGTQQRWIQYPGRLVAIKHDVSTRVNPSNSVTICNMVRETSLSLPFRRTGTGACSVNFVKKDNANPLGNHGKSSRTIRHLHRHTFWTIQFNDADKAETSILIGDHTGTGVFGTGRTKGKTPLGGSIPKRNRSFGMQKRGSSKTSLSFLHGVLGTTNVVGNIRLVFHRHGADRRVNLWWKRNLNRILG
jgi:hypothetical protein